MNRGADGPETRGVLLAGEAMGLLMADMAGDLSEVEHFSMAVAGAEYNVALGLARLGVPVTYVTKLGDDSIGHRIEKGLVREGIDTTGITWSAGLSTGLMFKARNMAGDPEIDYYRRGSAASSMRPGDIPQLEWERFGFLHVTGITPALGPQTLQMCHALIDQARDHGLIVTFDPNLRPQLWSDCATMIAEVNRLALRADVVLPGISEGKELTGADDVRGVADWYLGRGVRAVALKAGRKGAVLAEKGSVRELEGFPLERFIDTVGAGDGFAVGVISGMWDGLSLAEAVSRGNAIGAIQVGSRGDNEGLPDRRRLEAFMARGTGPDPEGLHSEEE
jgi:2-dehydro-3-deoxygluconokinase